MTLAAVPFVPAAATGSPEWWLERLSRRLNARAGSQLWEQRTDDRGRRYDEYTDGRRLSSASGMALFDAYYRGQHRSTYKIRKVLDAFGLDAPIYVNYCGVVIDSISERLGVNGLLFGKDDRAAEAAWSIWQDNDLDAGFKRGMRSGLVKGEFALILWPDDDWNPRISVEDGAQVIVSVSPETRKRRAALKVWTDEDEGGALFATLYLPDAVYKYRSARALSLGTGTVLTIGGTAWERRVLDGEPWPLPNPLGEVPVIPFPNKPDSRMLGESEIAKVVPIQDAINANIANVMLAGLYGAFRQRYAINVTLQKDPKTGETIQPWNVAEDELMTAPPREDGTETKFGEFGQTDLSGYIRTHETLTQAVATVSRFPPHYLLGSQGSFPSGEALTAVERGITAVAGERADDWKDPLEDAIRLAFRIKARAPGLSASAGRRFEKWGAMTDAEADFRDPETKSESQHVDAVVKKKTLDVPRRQLWSELGYSQQQILEWEKEAPDDTPPSGPPTAPQPIPGQPIPAPAIDSTGGSQLPS